MRAAFALSLFRPVTRAGAHPGGAAGMEESGREEERMSPQQTLAVVEATRVRSHDPAYHDYVQLLVGNVIAEARSHGWTVDRRAADEGTDTLLATTATADA